MRIGFDAKRSFNNRSGLGNYSRNLLRSLHNYFPENQYYLYTPGTDDAIFNVSGENFVIRQPLNPLHKIFSSYWRTFLISDLIKKDNLDIYHGLSHELPAGLDNDTRTVVTIHDLIFLRYPNLYNRADRLIYKKKFESACRKASRIVAVSNQTADDIEHFFNIGREKTEVVYQGCNQAFFKQPEKEIQSRIKVKYDLPESYILFVGTIEERKNLLTLVKAMHIARINEPLVVIGRKTGYFRKVDEYIRAHKLNFVRFYSMIDNEDLPSIYQMAAVFVYPSLFEGFGIPILEALASGTPVITSKGGCFEEAGGAGAKYINPSDEKELAEVLKSVLESAELRQHMVQKGLIHASDFTPEKKAGNMMNLYKNLLLNEK